MNTMAGHDAFPASRWPSPRVPGFPTLPMDLALILLSAGAGACLAQLFRWDRLDEVAPITAGEILLHNLMIALLAMVITTHAARGMMLINGLWLGMGLAASSHLAGMGRTLSLAAVHVPLEVVAWAMTIELARRFWPAVAGTVRRDPQGATLRRGLLVRMALTVVVYASAALAEWAAHSLIGV